MTKKVMILFFTFLLLSITNVVFAVGATREEIIAIPKTGMLNKPVELGEKELVVYRDTIVFVTANKSTKISPEGNFLMIVHVIPTDAKKTPEWVDSMRNLSSRWSNNGKRISASPVQIDEVTFYVAVNETDATCKIYGLVFSEHENDKRKVLLRAVEDKNNVFTNPFIPLDQETFFDAAYRKIIQYHTSK